MRGIKTRILKMKHLHALTQPNKLYNFVVTEHSLQFQKKINIRGDSYLKFDLDVPDFDLFDRTEGYHTLLNHHISIYGFQNDHIPVLTQYHYTAFFDKAGEKKVVHVYFDRNDHVVEIIYSNHDYHGHLQANSIPEKSKKQFGDIAKQYSLPLISQIRKLQRDYLDDVTKTLDLLKIDLEQLSIDIEKNKLAYVEKIDHILLAIDILIHMHDKNHLHLLKYFQQLKRDVISPPKNSPNKMLARQASLISSNFFSVLDKEDVTQNSLNIRKSRR